MPGALGTSKLSGARSEALAEYLFGRWGPVLRGRDDSDFGVDLYCALADEIGPRMLVRTPYTVQVKSSRGAWEFRDDHAVRWLVAHPTPFLLCVIDKDDGVIEVFHTFARFDLWARALYPTPLVLRPARAGVGSIGNWYPSNSYELGAPILRVSSEDLFDDEILAERKQVLEAWLNIERRNMLLRDIGMMRFRAPAQYTTNTAKFGGYVEMGLALPSDEQLKDAINVLAEALDCVGSQLGHRGREQDTDTVVLAMMLLRLLTDRGRKPLGIHNSGTGGVAALLYGLGLPLDQSAISDTLDRLLAAVAQIGKPLKDALRHDLNPTAEG